MTSDAIRTIFELLTESFPNPKAELNYETSFQLLIAVVLSAQSTDKSVNKITQSLFQHVKEAKDLELISLENLEQSLKTIGLYKVKARYLKTLSNDLVLKFKGKVPENRELLMQLKGVGRKTAHVVLNTLYGHEVIAVDTHVLRVSQRLEISHQNTPLGVEKDLMKHIPSEYLRNAHHQLILHGRYTCKARNPLCHQCILNKLCPSKKLSAI